MRSRPSSPVTDSRSSIAEIIPVREQISVTSAAPAIAGFHGAAMTNLLWANPGTPVLEIFSPEYLNACYEQIAFHHCMAYDASLPLGTSIPANI